MVRHSNGVPRKSLFREYERTHPDGYNPRKKSDFSSGGGGGGGGGPCSGGDGKGLGVTFLWVAMLLGAAIAAVLLIRMVFVFSECNSVEALTRAEQAVCRATSSRGEIRVSQSSLYSASSTKFSTHVFYSQPRVLSGGVVSSVVQAFRVYDHSWTSHGFALVHGSTVEYSITMDSTVHLHILAGKQFRRLEDELSFKSLESWTGTQLTGTFAAQDDDAFFFVVENTESTSSRGRWNLSATYLRYDLSSADEECTEEVCKYRGLSSSAYVVTSVSPNSSSIGEEIDVYQTLRYNPGPQAGVTVAFLLLISVLLAIPPVFSFVEKRKKEKFAAATQGPAAAPTNPSSPPLSVPLGHISEPLPASSAGLPPPPVYTAYPSSLPPPSTPATAFPTPSAPAYQPDEYPDPEKVIGV